MEDCGIDTEKSTRGAAIDGFVVFGRLFQPGRTLRGVGRVGRFAIKPRAKRRNVFFEMTVERWAIEVRLQAIVTPQLLRPLIGAGAREIENGAILQVATRWMVFESEQCGVAGAKVVAGILSLGG